MNNEKYEELAKAIREQLPAEAWKGLVAQMSQESQKLDGVVARKETPMVMELETEEPEAERPDDVMSLIKGMLGRLEQVEAKMAAYDQGGADIKQVHSDTILEAIKALQSDVRGVVMAAEERAQSVQAAELGAVLSDWSRHNSDTKQGNQPSFDFDSSSFLAAFGGAK